MTPDQQEFLRLIALLDEEIKSGRDDLPETPVSDGIRDELDVLWYRMSSEEIDEVRKLVPNTPQRDVPWPKGEGPPEYDDLPPMRKQIRSAREVEEEYGLPPGYLTPPPESR